ncbi:MAG: hypothetical protein IJP45_03055 [Paludibacteraceae bacterium]|nr:hypothetical protein [Paludibacteraceae bacterium]
MKKIYKLTIISITLFSFTSCVRFVNWEYFDFFWYESSPPNPSQIVGVWKAEDGAIIELHEDGTCSLHNVQRLIEYTACVRREDTCSVWNFNGYWRIEPMLSDYNSTDTIAYKVNLDSRPPLKGTWEMGDCEVRLRIHNKKVLGEIVPVMLYNFIGDPDNFETYDFYKQE